ncbi:uncharacterized protein LOC131928166 [Physella acuta]|uniref:uncharacterized protein LOC131928166 n=1 Tax=Physella acuta TaxID=109671 RepID=UPI0027DABD85|nr:uncharacterized protein LOC131928166 [Physella acuta]
MGTCTSMSQNDMVLTTWEMYKSDALSAALSDVLTDFSQHNTGEECLQKLRHLNDAIGQFFVLGQLQPKLINFAEISFKIHQNILVELGVKHYSEVGEEHAVSESKVCVLEEIRKSWGKLSLNCPPFCEKLVACGAFGELLYDLSKTLKICKKKRKGNKGEESQNLQSRLVPALDLILAVVRLEKRQKMFSEGKMIRLLKRFFKLKLKTVNSVSAILTCSRLNSHPEVTKYLNLDPLLTEVKASLKHWIGNRQFSLLELMVGLRELSSEAALKRALVDKGVHSIINSVLSTRDQQTIVYETLLLVWELCFDERGNSLIQADREMKTNLSKYSTQKLVADIFWLINEEVKQETDGVMKSLKDLNLRQTELQSAYMILQSNIGLTSAMEMAAVLVKCLQQFHVSLKQIRDFDAIYESNEDLRLIGDFLCKIKFLEVSRLFMKHANTSRGEQLAEGECEQVVHYLREISLRYSTWSIYFATRVAPSELLSGIREDSEYLIQVGVSPTSTPAVTDYVLQELYTNVRVLYNTAKLWDQPKSLRDGRIIQLLQSCVHVDTQTMLPVCALLSLVLIHDVMKVKLQVSCDETVRKILLIASRALMTENRSFDQFSVSDLLNGLHKLSKTADYQSQLVRLQILTLMKDVFSRGTPKEIVLAKNIVVELAIVKACRDAILRDKDLTQALSKHEIVLPVSSTTPSCADGEAEPVPVNKVANRPQLESRLSKRDYYEANHSPGEFRIETLQITKVNKEHSLMFTVPQDLKNELKKINFNLDRDYSIQPNLVTEDTFHLLKLGITIIEGFISKEDNELLTNLELLKLRCAHLSIPEMKFFGDFMSDIGFVEKSFIKYKSVLRKAGLEHLNVNFLEKISFDERQTLELVREFWASLSRASSKVAGQLDKDGVVQELYQDLVNLIDKTEQDLDDSFLFSSSLTTIYNIARSRLDEDRKTMGKLVDVLGNFLSLKPELSLRVLLTLAYMVDKSQIHLLTLNHSAFTIIPATRDEWEDTRHRVADISACEILEALYKICLDRKIQSVLEKERVDLVSLALDVLKYGDEAEKKIAGHTVLRLSVDEFMWSRIKKSKQIQEYIASYANTFETTQDFSNLVACTLKQKMADSTLTTQKISKVQTKIDVFIVYSEVDTAPVQKLSVLLRPHVNVVHKSQSYELLTKTTFDAADIIMIYLTQQSRPDMIFYCEFLPNFTDRPIILLTDETVSNIPPSITQFVFHTKEFENQNIEDIIIEIRTQCKWKFYAKQRMAERENFGGREGFPLDAFSSLSETSAWKEIEKALLSLETPANKVSDVHKTFQDNARLFNVLKLAVQCCTGLKYSSHYACYNLLNLLHRRVQCEREKEKIIICRILCDAQFCKLSFERYKGNLRKANLDHADDSIDQQEREADADYVKSVVSTLRRCWQAFSRASVDLARELVTNQIVDELVHDVVERIGRSKEILDTSLTFSTSVLTLYHLAIQPDLRQTLKDRQIVYALGNFLTYDGELELTTILLVTMAMIVDEYQTHLLTSHEGFLQRLLPSSKCEWQTTSSSVSFKELLVALTELSRRDKVKNLLVNKNVLDLITDVFTSGDLEEKEKAAKLLMELSFSEGNRARIKEKEPLVQCLNTLVDKANTETRKAANRILWWINTDIQREHVHTDVINGHIMISYNSGDRETLRKVYDTLKAAGYRTWMDIYDIKGSTLDAMAKAVESSDVVLICMSKKYMDSTNCRLEAEYAANLHKPIIPLLMEHSYKPSGWLGILLGSKMFYDFSGEKYSFDEKIKDLIRDIGDRGKAVK